MNYKKLLFLILALFVLTGCGKNDDALPEVSAEMVEQDVDMIFTDVSEEVTAKDETNLRTFPGQGENSSVLYTLQNGEVAERIGISDSGWSKVIYQGQICYAVSNFLTTDLDYVPENAVKTQFAEKHEMVTAKDAVNLRNIPSTGDNSRIVGQLKNGDVAACIGVSGNGWAKLKYEEKTCYAVYSYLTNDLNYAKGQDDVDPNVTLKFKKVHESVTAKDFVNLRTIPNVKDPNSKIIGKLTEGEIATRIGTSNNGWSKLAYKNQVCYAASSYITVLEVLEDEESLVEPESDGTIKTQFEEAYDLVTAKIEVNLRTMPSVTESDSKVIHTLKNGEPVTRTGINVEQGWSRVEYEGQILYCVSSYLVPYSPPESETTAPLAE